MGAAAVMSNCKVRGSRDTTFVLNSEMGEVCCVLPFTVCCLIVPSMPPVLFPLGSPRRQEASLSSAISFEVGEEWQGARKQRMHSNIPVLEPFHPIKLYVHESVCAVVKNTIQ